LGIHHIQTVVIDQHRLLLEPICPALSADLFDDTRANGPGERRLYKPCARLAATHASNCFRHA